MIDVQIVAGRYPELLKESMNRILQLDEIIKHVYVANNTGKSIEVSHDRVTVIENEWPLSFEKNHNNLAKTR